MTRATSDLTATLEALQQTLAALTARVARLEAQLVDAPPHEDEERSLDVAAGRDASPRRPGEAAHAVEAEAIGRDVIIAIAAAVAAYLGERAHVKQVRLISSPAWGRQGRVSVQASHTLPR